MSEDKDGLNMMDVNEALSRDIAETKEILIRLRSNAGLLMAEWQRKEVRKIERRCAEIVADTFRLAKLWNIPDADLDVVMH